MKVYDKRVHWNWCTAVCNLRRFKFSTDDAWGKIYLFTV